MIVGGEYDQNTLYEILKGLIKATYYIEHLVFSSGD